MTTPVKTAPAKGAGSTQNQMSSRPFITGTREIETHTYDETKQVAAGTQTMPVYDLVTDGYVAGLYILVDATVTGNTTAATAVFNEDGPWNAIQTVTFSDVSNRPIIGPMSGWELKEVIKFGGYSFSDDSQDSTSYTTTTGTGASGGSFGFILHLPIEFVHRNAMGSLTNLSNAAVFRLELTLAGSTTLYNGTTGTPVTLPSVRFRIHQHGWMESKGADPFGNPASPAPPAVDSVQYWERQTYTVNAGAQNFRLTPFEGHVRNIMFVLEDSNSSRLQGESDWPDPLRFRYDSVVPVDRLKAVWKRYVEEVFGYTAVAPTALPTSAIGGGVFAILPGASFKDNGVYPISYTRDFGLKAGAEQCFGYNYVSSGTALRFDGTIGGSGSHTLTVLVNYINPAGGNPLALTGGK